MRLSPGRIVSDLSSEITVVGAALNSGGEL
jgi:hypothetical protein